MTTSVYFNNYDYHPEQTLYDDLIIESIKIYGVDCKYLPRTLDSYDPLYTESSSSSFNDAIDIEMYVKSIDGFTGDGIFLSKFGLEIRDEVIFTVSKSRWEKQVALTDPTRPRPMEGDIVWFPLNKKPFQIKFVDHKPFFFQHGKLQTYDLVCELFEYSGEEFDTGIPEIDTVQDDLSTDVLQYALLTEDGEYLLTENGQYIIQEEFNIEDKVPGADNDVIDQIVIDDDIIDWTETNPFCEAQKY